MSFVGKNFVPPINTVYLSYLAESKQCNLLGTKFLIVRKLIMPIPNGFIHLPELSPSIELLETTNKWKKENKENWWQLYKPLFEKELEENIEINNGITKIWKELQNSDVILYCYCKNTKRCHRYLVGKYLEKLGFKVDYRIKQHENNLQLNMFSMMSQ